MQPATSDEPWRLRPLQIPGVPARDVDITADGVTIGRAATNSIVVAEAAFPYVSAHHCRVSLVDGAPVVEDLHSRNGTLHNGRRVARAPLAHGDVVQLGATGPRLVVARGDRAIDSRAVLATAIEPSIKAGPELTRSSVVRIRRALGVPLNADFRALIRPGQRRWLVAAAAAVAVLVAAAGAWLLAPREVAEAGRRLTEEVKAKLTAAAQEFDAQRAAWVAEREALRRETSTLQERLHRLESDAGESAGELQRLRDRLGEASRQVQLYDPVHLEQDRLASIRRVTRAVVLIENTTRFRDRDSGKLVHAERAGDGTPLFNLDEQGEPFGAERSGSGFCVSADGWILTNAHVVAAWRDDDATGLSLDAVFDPEIELRIVFSENGERHGARTVKSLAGADEDLALLQIEPFAGMPHIDGLDPALPVPAPGTEVLLAGFPLGTMALQAGDVVIASTFKGILSRVVGPFLQVDAAVHPGNSGGPVIDGQGRIIGVVTRVQLMPGGVYTPAIGYVIPVAALAKIWPPGADVK